MRIIFFIIFLSFNLNAEIIKPNPDFLPEDIISIQLNALMNNDNPYKNAGIEQTWEFAHPFNRQYTGPLNKFIKMMYSPAYSKMINHQESFYCIQAERAVLETIGGDCDTAVGGFAKLLDNAIVVAIIPYTLKNTILKYKNVNDEVNVEVDMMSKYVERILNYRKEL